MRDVYPTIKATQWSKSLVTQVYGESEDVLQCETDEGVNVIVIGGGFASNCYLGDVFEILDNNAGLDLMVVKAIKVSKLKDTIGNYYITD